jgi:hypothetical protein
VAMDWRKVDDWRLMMGHLQAAKGRKASQPA